MDPFKEINKAIVDCPACGKKGKLCINKGDQWSIYHPADEFQRGTTCPIPVRFRAQLAIELLRREGEIDVGTEMIDKCVLCDKPGYSTSYFPPPDHYEEVEIFLCRSHKGNYMAHGIRILDQLWLEGKIPAE